MAIIGSFKKSGEEFQGKIVTLATQVKGVRIVPVTTQSGDKAPSHRVYLDGSEIGAAWARQTSEGHDYLSLSLDDPNLPSPIWANLFRDKDGQGFSLIWSRGRWHNGN